jgi:hypothetical protein
VQTFATPETLLPDNGTSSKTLFLILYPDGVQEDVIQILDSVGVPGFTETEKVVGRGTRGRHFDNPIWPGADGMIYAIVGEAHVRPLRAALTNYNRSLEVRSKNLYGLHIFTWSCDQVL